MSETLKKAPAEKKHITKLMRRIWGIGEFGEGMSGSPGQLYGTYFLTNIIMVSPAVLAVTTMINSIVGFIVQPISALILDGTKPMKWGKLRSWVLIGPFIMLVTSPLVFVKVGSPTANAYLICMISLIQSVIYSTVVTSQQSLVPSMCAYDEEVETLASNRMTGYNAGRMIASYLTPYLLNVMIITSLGNASYYVLTLSFTVILVFCYFVTFRLSAGYEGNGKAPSASGEKLTLKQISLAVAAAPQIIVLIIADVTSTLGSFLLPGLLIYMYQYVIEGGGMQAWMPTHTLVTGLTTLVGSYMARWFMRKVSNKKMLLCGMYLCIAVFIFCTRFFTGDVVLFIAMSAIALFFQGITNPIEGTLYYDVATIAQAKTGEDATSTFVALSQYNARIAGLIRGVIISVLFTAIAFDPTKPVTDALKVGFTNAYSLAFCVIPIVGAIVLLLFYRITPERLAQARETIAARANSK